MIWQWYRRFEVNKTAKRLAHEVEAFPLLYGGRDLDSGGMAGGMAWRARNPAHGLVGSIIAADVNMSSENNSCLLKSISTDFL